MTEVLTYEALKDERDALAVENQALKSAITGKAYIDFVTSNGWNPGMKTINGKFAGFMDAEIDFGCMAYDHAKKLIDAVETPATSAALAAIQVRAKAEAFAEIIEFIDRRSGLAEMKTPWDLSSAIVAHIAELREAK